MRKSTTHLMSICIIGILCILFQSNVFAQLTGGNVYPINGTENAPSSFQSLKTAITYLSANGVNGSGQVVLEFQAPYDPAADTVPSASITIPNITGTSASLGVTFRPGTGFSTKISISIAAAGSIILNGAKYITFDGRQGGSGATGLTLQNGTNVATALTSTVQLINDAQFNTFTYLTFANAATNSSSATATVLFGTSTGSTGNSNNTISNNTFGPVGGSLTSCSYHIISSGTAGVLNASNSITNNNITNFVFRAIVITGTGSGDSWVITGNSFYSSIVGTGTQRCVNFLSGSGSGHTISNNFIGGQAANCGGAAYVASAIIAIDLAVGNGAATSVQGNVMKNMANVFTSTGTCFAMMQITAGNLNIGTVAGNVLGSQSDTGSVRINTTSTTASTIFSFGIIVAGGTGTIDIQNNTFGSITLNPIGVASASTFIFRAVDNEATTLTSINISNNKAGGLVTNSMRSSGTGRPVAIQGFVTFSTATVTGDSVRNITNSTTSGSIGGFGFFDGVTGQTYTCRNNAMNNFSALTNTTAISGITAQITAASVISSVAINRNTMTNFTSTGNANVGGIIITNGSQTGSSLNGVCDSNSITTFSNSNSGTSAVVYGIQGATSTTTGLDISYNTISGLSTASASTTNTSTSAVFGIGQPSAATNLTITQNNINTLSCTGAAATHVIGVGVFGGGTIARNRIYGLTNANATTAGTVKGIVMRSTGTFNVINNQISITGPTNDIGVYGIENNSAATQINAYYNTVHIGGTATGTNNTTAFFRNGAAVNTIVDLKDNIFSNIRTGGTGQHVCVINNSTTPATGWDSTSGKNNNNFFVIPVGATNVGIWNGSNLTFSTWKSTVNADILSISANNTAGTTDASNINIGNFYTNSVGNLNILISNIESWFTKGRGTQIASVNNDFNSNPRSTSVAGGAPCIGSHEYTPLTAPPTASASGAPALNTTTTYTLGGRTVGSIAWGGTGTVPSSVTFQFYPGANPPNSIGFNVANGYWVVTVPDGSGYSYDIVLNYDPSMIGTVPADTNVMIAKSEDGGTTYNAYLVYGTNAGEYERNSAQHYITLHGLTSFSLFALGDNNAPLPVELASFSSVVDKRKVTLNWSTMTEQNNSGFEIERKAVNANAWSKVGNVAGAGNSNTVKNYSFSENNVATGNYNYRLKQIDNNGNYKYYNLSNEVVIGVPAKFELSQNYPNPFNPTTNINYDLPFDSKVSIKIFDITGKEVYTLVNQVQPAGFNTVKFNASELSSGTYFYMINAEGGNQSFTKTLKMTLVK
ncbi:MAG: T9SS type A sorting domain-containing protein [Bacteroidetes bacterium]|nr:T9SS type A sorting domain-containing protein [Bacteroidota bacterium]